MFFLSFFIHSLLLYQAFASEDSAPEMVVGDAFLLCRAPRDAVITVLEWSKTDLSSDDYVFFYRKDRSYEKYQHQSFRGRVELSDPSMKDGDVSIILKNVTVSDDGTYICRIITSNTGSSQRVFRYQRSLRVIESGHLGKHEETTESGEIVSVGVTADGSVFTLATSVSVFTIVVAVAFII